jgi:type III restriction enzyme
MVSKKDKEVKALPLLEKAKSSINGLMFDLPDFGYLQDNLKHDLRGYQRNALLHLHWSQTQENTNNSYDQLMFNMATGSGKTDVMAAAILYLFHEHNFQNFIFVSNTTAVVNKTRDNFLNLASSKYLFSSPIVIDGEHVDIKAVESFPIEQESNTIYLKLTTIQTLSNELNDPEENGLTYENLANFRIVILADEAHHFNVNTKNTSKEAKIERSWESVLDKIRDSNKANRQLEFTATIDIDKPEVYEKYKNKIIFKYDLDQFMEEGYSKKVFRLQANTENNSKLLNAVLLNEYRKRIATKLSINDFKPVMLVKSNRIDTSKQVEKDFLDMMKDLSSEYLKNFINENQKLNSSSVALRNTYKYWLTQDLTKAVAEFQQDFNLQTTINVNEGGRKGLLSDERDFKNLNSLEDINNPFRIIFAVAKLTEGWDVLNLYDIVRVSEEKESLTMNSTNAEAQLVGRGARYYPFIYQNKKSYTRRFDNNSFERQLLETLYYHTINNSKYIDNLNKSFDKMDLVVNKDSDYNVYSAKVKKSFVRTDFYQKGNLYYNQVKKVPDSDYKTIGDYGIKKSTLDIDYNLSTTESNLHDKFYSGVSESNIRYDLVADFSNSKDYRLIKRAMSRNKFYRFSVMKKYLPMIKSIREFTTSSNWLGNLRVQAKVPDKYDKDLTQIDKLHVLDKALQIIQRNVVKNYQKERGTNKFVSIAVKDVVKDYNKAIPKLSNKVVSEIIEPKKMLKEDWFPYDYAIADKLESSLINRIGSWIDELKQKHKNIYFIRNEETTAKWSLHEFEDKDIKHYEGYMPDFILVLDDGNVMYQIYMEPKGDQLLERDAWKQDLLESIKPENIEIIGETRDVRLYGVKFYTTNDGRNIYQELKQKNIIN